MTPGTPNWLWVMQTSFCYHHCFQYTEWYKSNLRQQYIRLLDHWSINCTQKPEPTTETSTNRDQNSFLNQRQQFPLQQLQTWVHPSSQQAQNQTTSQWVAQPSLTPSVKQYTTDEHFWLTIKLPIYKSISCYVFQPPASLPNNCCCLCTPSVYIVAKHTNQCKHYTAFCYNLNFIQQKCHGSDSVFSINKNN